MQIQWHCMRWHCFISGLAPITNTSAAHDCGNLNFGTPLQAAPGARVNVTSLVTYENSALSVNEYFSENQHSSYSEQGILVAAIVPSIFKSVRASRGARA